MLKEMLEEEGKRNKEMQEVYQYEIQQLPRGSVVIKLSGKKEYCYLQYREGDKVISKYIGHANEHAARLRELVEERRSLERILRRLRKEERYIEKALRLND
jgi:hypothetical protein